MSMRVIRAVLRVLSSILAVATIAAVAMVGLALLSGYRPVVITTGSMGDTAPPGTMIIAAPRPAGAVQVGDILVMQRPDKAAITHRVIEIETTGTERFAVTQGDANESADPAPYALGEQELVSRWIVPGAGQGIRMLGNPVAGLLIVTGAVALVSLIMLRFIWAPVRAPVVAAVPAGTTAAPRPVRTRSRIAVLTTMVMGVMFGGVAWSLFLANDSIAGNQFTTADCFDAQIGSVQRGQTINSLNGLQNIPITPVDPTTSFLLISTRSSANEPADAHVQGRLAAGSTIELLRNTDAGVPPPITVDWTVVEYACGVQVQRGVANGGGTAQLDIPIAAVDPATSFVLTTSVGDAADTDHDGDDLHIAELTATTNLRIRSDAGTTLPASHSYAWQVVTFSDGADAGVQTGTVTLDPTDTETLTLAAPVDPDATFVLASVATAGAGPDISERMIRAHLSSPTTVELTRLGSGDPVEVHVQVVSLNDGTTVQHGTVDMIATQPAAAVTIDRVDPARASALSTVQVPGATSGGATDMVADDVAGEASATFSISDPATVMIQRDATTAAASFGWQVIEWGGPTWWDPTYQFRQRIDVTTTTEAAPDAYTVPVTVDHAALVAAGISLTDGSDLRLLQWDGAAWQELDRVLDEGSTWNTADTTLWFRTQDPIAAATTASYWLYFGNTGPAAPLEDPENVWLLYEGFESGTLGDFEDRTGGTGWYRALPWARRIPLTVSSAAVTTDLFDYPLLVQLTSADLSANAQSDGDDIRFTAADGVTVLPHEIESWNAGTGALSAWVRLPYVSASADTPIYLMYGAADAPNQSSPRAAWEQLGSAWHLATDPAGAAPQVDDSSARNRDGLSSGAMTGGDLVSGVAGRALDLDGSNDRLDIEAFDLAPSGLSVQAWFNADSFGTDPVLVAKGSAAGTQILELAIDDTTVTTGQARLRVRIDGGVVEVLGGAVSTGGWHHVAGSWDGATLRLYVDGAGVDSVPAPGSVDQNAAMPVSFGALPDGTRPLDGRLDEVHLADTAHPAPWIEAAETNQRSPGSFVAAGAPTGGTWFDQGDWLYRKPVTIDADLVAGPLTDHPVLVQLTDTDFAAKAQANGDDIVFTAADGVTRLDHELESWSSGTGAITAWVRVPAMDGTTDTSLFVYYGNATAADQQDPAGVFGPDSDQVLHLDG